jgi:hypothetical protein
LITEFKNKADRISAAVNLKQLFGLPGDNQPLGGSNQNNKSEQPEGMSKTDVLDPWKNNDGKLPSRWTDPVADRCCM